MTEPPPDLAAVAATTAAVYERNAARFDAERLKSLFERVWLDRFLELLPDGGAVLDLGCGSGAPIADYIRGRGHPVTGLDVSAAMLDLARARCPDGDWRQGDMRTLDLPERFHGVLGWHSLFHLRPAEQRTTLARIARHLHPGGALLLTVGPRAGEVLGRVGDDPVYHASLAPADYRTVLDRVGLEVVRFTPEDPECDVCSVLLARRRDG
jgi:SAM-dependent methyltransferase